MSKNEKLSSLRLVDNVSSTNRRRRCDPRRKLWPKNRRPWWFGAGRGCSCLCRSKSFGLSTIFLWSIGPEIEKNDEDDSMKIAEREQKKPTRMALYQSSSSCCVRPSVKIEKKSERNVFRDEQILANRFVASTRISFLRWAIRSRRFCSPFFAVENRPTQQRDEQRKKTEKKTFLCFDVFLFA